MSEIKADPGSDVLALVERVSGVANLDVRRLARIVSELMELHPARRCERFYYQGSCIAAIPLDQDVTSARWCPACRDRALRERLDRIARGEEV